MWILILIIVAMQVLGIYNGLPKLDLTQIAMLVELLLQPQIVIGYKFMLQPILLPAILYLVHLIPELQQVHGYPGGILG